jgi:hypothetical protein
MGGAASVDTYFSSNAFWDGSGWKYIGTAAATQYTQNAAGDHRWYTAPAGTAGNAISFTQAMTLDASGRLGIGTSSPTVTLQLGNGSGLPQQFFSGAGYDLYVGASGGTMFGVASGAISLVFNTASVPLGIGTSGAQPLIFGTQAFERARITAGGDVGIGTASPAARLHLAIETAGTNDIAEVARVQRNTSGTAAVGLGAGLNFVLERADGVADLAARVSSVWSNATSGVAAGYLRFDTATNGAFTERLRVDTTTTAGQTALLLWDVDNGTLERVTVGAADSGGVGFKVLRIPN